MARRPRVVVIGAGFIGTELAATLRSLDVAVTLVEQDVAPLRRALGERLGEYVAQLHRNNGVEVLTSATVTAVRGEDRVTGVVLDDGRRLSADVVVVALGATPNVEWLAGSGVTVDDGVLTDGGALAVPGAVAVGDVARCLHPLVDGEWMRVEHWSNAVEQAAVAARSLLDPASRSALHALPSFWSHFYGLRLHSVGFPAVADGVEFVGGVPEQGKFLAVYRRGGRVIGAVTHGFIRRLASYREQIAAAHLPV